jgi:hypothetical protein
MARAEIEARPRPAGGRLGRWLLLLLVAALLGIAALYGAARLWMLDDDARIEAAVTADAGGMRSLDLLRPGSTTPFMSAAPIRPSSSRTSPAARPAPFASGRPTRWSKAITAPS